MNSTKEQQPKLSVLIRAYNNAGTIVRAIESVLSQKAPFDIQIIVVNDASTDDTHIKLVPYISEGIVEYREQSIRVGAVLNFIEASDMAKGKYTAVLDADDYYTASLFLWRAVSMLEANRKLIAVYANYEGQAVPKFCSKKDKPALFPEGKLFEKLLFYGNFIPSCAIVYHTPPPIELSELFRLERNTIPVVSDYPVNLYLSRRGEIEYLPSAVYHYTTDQLTPTVSRPGTKYKEIAYRFGIFRIRCDHIKMLRPDRISNSFELTACRIFFFCKIASDLVRETVKIIIK